MNALKREEGKGRVERGIKLWVGALTKWSWKCVVSSNGAFMTRQTGLVLGPGMEVEGVE